MTASFDTDLLASLLREFDLQDAYTGLSDSETAKLYQASHSLTDLKHNCSPENRKGSTAPLSYYGGKKTLAAIIAEIITSQKYQRYIEPFAGGAAVAFTPVTKGVREVLLNDLNREMINFWEHCADPVKHKKMCAIAEKRGICHEEYFNLSNVIYKAPDGVPPEERAWATFFTLNNSIFSMAGSRLSIGKGRGPGLKAKLRKLADAHQAHMQDWQFLTRDACVVLRRYAYPDTMIYADPPYIPTSTAAVDQGHYSGYSAADYKKLIAELGATSGKFVLSSYENEILAAAIEKYKWRKIVVRTTSSASAGGSRTGSKDTMNINTIIRNDIGLQVMRHEWLVLNFDAPPHLFVKPPKKK